MPVTPQTFNLDNLLKELRYSAPNIKLTRVEPNHNHAYLLKHHLNQYIVSDYSMDPAFEEQYKVVLNLDNDYPESNLVIFRVYIPNFPTTKWFNPNKTFWNNSTPAFSKYISNPDYAVVESYSTTPFAYSTLRTVVSNAKITISQWERATIRRRLRYITNQVLLRIGTLFKCEERMEVFRYNFA